MFCVHSMETCIHRILLLREHHLQRNANGSHRSGAGGKFKFGGWGGGGCRLIKNLAPGSNAYASLVWESFYILFFFSIILYFTSTTMPIYKCQTSRVLGKLSSLLWNNRTKVIKVKSCLCIELWQRKRCRNWSIFNMFLITFHKFLFYSSDLHEHKPRPPSGSSSSKTSRKKRLTGPKSLEKYEECLEKAKRWVQV